MYTGDYSRMSKHLINECPSLSGNLDQRRQMRVSIFSKYPARVAGLGIAIGESLRYVFNPDVSNMCSSVACSYILCHAAYQAFEARQDNAIVSAMFDSLIFDGIASAMLPTFIAYQASKITCVCLRESTTVPDVIITWGPTVMGLCLLAALAEPVDQYVNGALNDTIRKLYI